MIVKCFTVGISRTNCYIVSCAETGKALIIDPGFDRNAEAARILEEIREKKLEIEYIVNTHGHIDHIAGNGVVKEATGGKILIHELDAPMLVSSPERLLKRVEFSVVTPPADRTLRDGDEIHVGNISLRVLHTPGHSKGGVSLLGDECVFTGDTLFAGSIGRTDIPGASFEEISNSLNKRLIGLPDHLKIYPGHGSFSTMGEEKRNNIFFRGNLKETLVISRAGVVGDVGESLAAVAVRDIMTPIERDKHTCREDDSIADLKKRMEHGWEDARALVVVDDKMKLLGVITSTDVSRAQPSDLVRDVMSKNPHLVLASDKANSAWVSLKRFRTIPVVNETNIVEGLLNRETLMQLILKDSHRSE